jgi:hypothetical protein
MREARPAVRAVVFLVVAAVAGTFAPPATPQDGDFPVEVLIFNNFTDTPLSEAVELVVTCGLGAFRVTVEPGLADHRITLSLKGESPEEALRLVAKAAKAYLVKADAKHYEIRSTPSGPEESGKPAEAAPEVPLPDWAKAIEEKLEATMMPGVFEHTPLENALAAIAAKAGVPIRLDPEVLKLRTEQDLTIDVHIMSAENELDPFGKPSTVSARELLWSVLTRPRLLRDYRWRCLFVSTSDRLAAFPAEVSAAKAAGEEVRKTLAEKVVSVKFERASLKKAAEHLSKQGGLLLKVDPAAAKAAGKRTFAAQFADVPFGDALSAVFLPEGFDVAVGEGGALVVRLLP